MPEIITKTTRSILINLLIYAALVVAALFAFPAIRGESSAISAIRYSYSLCGPALSLFTHMSYPLFAAQSLFLIPWLVIAALHPRARYVAWFAFAVTWIAIGWYMHDLF